MREQSRKRRARAAEASLIAWRDDATAENLARLGDALAALQPYLNAGE